MKINEKLRGNTEEQNIKHLDKKFQKMLGRDANRNEIRLFPYLINCLMDQNVDRSKLDKHELDLLQDYQNKGLLVREFTKIGCTKEFWDFINEIVYDRYVCEVEE